MCKYFLYSCNCLWVTQCHVCILLKEKIFFLHMYPQLSFFLNLVCIFFLSPLPLFFPKTFFPKTCFVFPIFIGGKFFLTFVVLRGSCCSSQGELSLFSLTMLRMFSVYLLIGQSLSIRDKKGETQMTCLFCFVQGENIKTF